MNFFTRGVQLTVIRSFCYLQNPAVITECRYISNTEQALDLFASAFNFSIYLVLIAFWAEQYYSMGYSTSSPKPSLVQVRRRVNLVFWVLFSLAYLMVVIVTILTFTLPITQFSYLSPAYRYTRLSVRLTLTFSICLGLVVYGYLAYMKFSSLNESRSHLQKISNITIICSMCYFLLCVANIVTTLMGDTYTYFAYVWIVRNLFSVVELFANCLLLFCMTPSLIINLCKKLIDLISFGHSRIDKEETSSTFISLDIDFDESVNENDSITEEEFEEGTSTGAGSAPSSNYYMMNDEERDVKTS
ncbi:hypothetical protein AKO1_013397 [Acrasis kona]